MTEPIQVWPFYDAPEEYQNLSTNGGDEDWLAFIPADVWEKSGEYISWMGDGGTPFGVCGTSYYPVSNGVVAIGCHA